ncbi:phospholipase C, delta [Trypanosoma conorhini]|uniref:Phospholipase C, delta n=1 Tax=Trypanosoma conorhini TaxID=83891 RepID=A0A422PG53_9TRYP|nr:phospholipase C, delta [Trypanosoma conorhini]RNF16673.1 phospholipase C, delta [Trypanosoma conorhini]
MGCSESKGLQTKPRPHQPASPKKEPQSPKKNAGNGCPAMSPRNCEQQANAERYLRLILEGAEKILGGGFRFASNEESQQVALTFLNSCVEVTRTRFRLTTGVILETIGRIASEEKLKTILGTLPNVKENCVDEGFSRLLYDWLETSSGFSAALQNNAERSTQKTKGGSKNAPTWTGFSNLLVSHLCAATAIPAIDIFSKFAQGKPSMTEKEYGNFLRETQHSDLTDTQIREKYNFRFGGAIHKYNFNTYFGGLSTNSALDPMRTADVWQDMTQPLTRYSVNMTRVESEADLNRALVDSSRAFLLNVVKDEKGILCSGSCPIRTILESIQAVGFSTNSYPIVLCLSPVNPISVELGKELAFFIKKDFSTLFAKGLMFEGSIISDPKFSPAALRKKVLLMGHQSRLKPFVGCYVADLNRESLGVRVTEVVQGTPAAKAGLTKDDWLTHFNGEPIPNKQSLRERLSNLRLGGEFSLRKENLEDIKIVVGGTVDAADQSASAELSEILFLKYTEGKGGKPWETQVVREEALQDPKLMREDLDDHFAFFTSEGTAANADQIKTATKLGVQFIDTGNAPEAQIWARGRFVDNGGSGYLIKSDAAVKPIVSVTVEVIAGLQDMKGACLQSGKVRVYGTGSARVDGNRFNFKECNDATVAVLECDFAHDGGFFSFVAAFPLGLLRSGYRVLPMQQTGGPRKLATSKLGAYCFIRRNE